MKVTITTDLGVVVRVIERSDMGNLDKAIPRSHFFEAVLKAIQKAGEIELQANK